MKKISSLFKNISILLLIGIIIIIMFLITYFVLNFSITECLLGAILVIFIWILVLTYKRNQASQGAQLLEQSIKTQADDHIMSSRPAKREEIEQLKAKLLHGFDMLKKSKLGRGRSSRFGLYALPFYVFIGPSGAGKTTAIDNSGLDFPQGTKHIKGVAGTRNCEWSLSNQAIILDTAGRYMTEEEDKEEWLTFLEILKKHRWRRPINGVIIGISIDSLASSKFEKIETHAWKIRSRIDEIIDKLGIIPVYLVFTKCDLIQGFVEFFEDLNRVEREQVWGCTLTTKQQEDPKPGEVFESEFMELYKYLLNIRLTRLSSSTKRDIRQRIFNFPASFLSLKENLSHFVGKLFLSNPYEKNPIFRGFYFTSGTQEGVPIDRVIKAIADQFDLAPEIATAFDPEMEKKSYFIKNMFTDIIIPDQNFKFHTKRTTLRERLLRYGIGIALGLFILLTLLGFFKSKNGLTKIYSSIENLNKMVVNDAFFMEQQNQINYFHDLDILRQNIEYLGNFKSIIFSFGMHRGNRVLEKAESFYCDKIKYFFQNYIVDNLSLELKKLYGELEKDQDNLKTSSKVRDYEDVYYLLINRIPIEKNKNKRDNLSNILNQFIKDNYVKPPDLSEDLLKKQVRFVINLVALTDNDFFNFQKDEELSKRKVNIKITSLSDRYDVIKQNADNETQLYTIRELVGNGNEYFKNNIDISRFFTKEGWEKYIDNNQYDDTLKKNRLKLTDRYFEEYEKEWSIFLNKLEYQNINDFDKLIKFLNVLAESNSPLKTLIDNVSIQTKYKKTWKEFIDKIYKKFSEKEKYPAPKIDQRFASLHNLNNSQNLNTILDQYKIISIKLKTMIKEENGLKTITTETLGGSGELRNAIKTIREILPDENKFDSNFRKNIFERPIFMAWSLITAHYTNKLNVQWQKDVYDKFNKFFSNKYPFKENENIDAAIKDFADFFRPEEGIFDKFKNEHLKIYFEKKYLQSDEWRMTQLTKIEQYAEKVKKLQDVWFNSGVLELNFSIKFMKEKSDIKPIFFKVNDDKQIFKPADSDEKHFSLKEKSFPKEIILGKPKGWIFKKEENLICYGKDWGLFRLLNDAIILPDNSNDREFYFVIRLNNENGKYKITKNSNYQHKIEFILIAHSVENPFGNREYFKQFQCPRALN